MASRMRSSPALINPLVRRREKFSSEQVMARLFLPMFLEATRVLQEELVKDARDVDLGLIYGIGFPAFKGGLLFWADTLGLDRILKMLEPLGRPGPADGTDAAVARNGPFRAAILPFRSLIALINWLVCIRKI